jgi:hypothetical protein
MTLPSPSILGHLSTRMSYQSEARMPKGFNLRCAAGKTARVWEQGKGQSSTYLRSHPHQRLLAATHPRNSCPSLLWLAARSACHPAFPESALAIRR